jgi:hypothetical protein
MTTETLVNNTNTNSKSPKTWLAIGVMFIAGLAGGVFALNLVSQRGNSSHDVVAEGPSAPAATRTISDGATSANAATQDEIRELRDEVDQLRAAAQSNAGGNVRNELINQPRSTVRQPSSATSEGQRTLAYWNKLNSIMSREAAMRAAPPQLTAGNAMSFVSNQSSAYEDAAAAIRQLNPSGIDPQVANIGREIAAWYDEGIANSRSAESLLGSDDIAARQGAAGQGWSSSEKSHREKCLAINRRGEQLRQELSRKYGLEFPPMQ